MTKATTKPKRARNGVGSGEFVLLRESSAQAYVRSLNMQAKANRNLARSHLYDNKRELAHYDLKVAEALEWASEEFRRLMASSERRQPQENPKDEPRRP